MPQNFLNRFQACSLLDVLGGKGVPQTVNTCSFDAGPFQIFGQHFLYSPGTQGLVHPVQEKIVSPRTWPTLQVGSQCLAGLGVERKRPALSPKTRRNPHQTGFPGPGESISFTFSLTNSESRMPV